jgi:hypothetical protein
MVSARFYLSTDFLSFNEAPRVVLPDCNWPLTPHQRKNIRWTAFNLNDVPQVFHEPEQVDLKDSSRKFF